MTNRVHAVALEQVFRAWGLDARVVETGNGLWAVTITRSDGKIVCLNDDAVRLYDTVSAFYNGAETGVIPLC